MNEELARRKLSCILRAVALGYRHPMQADAAATIRTLENSKIQTRTPVQGFKGRFVDENRRQFAGRVWQRCG